MKLRLITLVLVLVLTLHFNSSAQLNGTYKKSNQTLTLHNSGSDTLLCWIRMLDIISPYQYSWSMPIPFRWNSSDEDQVMFDVLPQETLKINMSLMWFERKLYTRNVDDFTITSHQGLKKMKIDSIVATQLVFRKKISTDIPIKIIK